MVSFKLLAPLAAVGVCTLSAHAGVVTINQTFVNSTNSVQVFTYTRMLLGADSEVSGMVMGGAVAATLTDLNGNGATLSSVGLSPIYTALIGAASVHTLLDGGFTFSVGQFLSQSTNPASFGDPIPSLPVPDEIAPGALGISLTFALTPGDAVSFAATFVVDGIVPTPGALPMLAAAVLAGNRRRRR